MSVNIETVEYTLPYPMVRIRMRINEHRYLDWYLDDELTANLPYAIDGICGDVYQTISKEYNVSKEAISELISKALSDHCYSHFRNILPNCGI